MTRPRSRQRRRKPNDKTRADWWAAHPDYFSKKQLRYVQGCGIGPVQLLRKMIDAAIAAERRGRKGE